MIYLDNAATTPIHEDVLKEMLPYFNERYGNPSSLHKLGREANNALLLARKRIRDAINSDSKIIFTSGATEANNLALKGVMHARRGRHLIVSSIEHESILEPAKSLEREGYKVSYIPVDKYGIIDLDVLENMINDDTAIVSVMLTNNEVGTIEPLDEVIDIAHKHGVLVHSDIVQATGKMAIDASKLDLLTLSAHKMYGPKGVGALCIKDIEIMPILDGGGHEYNLRSGTQNVPAIVGMGKAFEISRKFDYKRVEELRDYMIKQLLEIPNSRLNGHTNRIANNIHITFLGVNGEDLIIKLSEKGVAASTGSACSINKQKASHVLKAMNFRYEEITGSLRLTLGIQNTRDEIEEAVEIISDVVKELRKISPFNKHL
jgi:cysteine desulfurase